MYKVIIVDDEKNICDFFSKNIHWENLGLENAGHFYNAKDALCFLEENHTDIVITDISMPNMNGIEFTQKIKEKFPQCIVAFLSAYDDFTYAKEGIKKGIFEYLLKPIDIDEIEEFLNKARNELIKQGINSNDTFINSYMDFISKILDKNDVDNESLFTATFNLSLNITEDFWNEKWLYGKNRFLIAIQNIMNMEGNDVGYYVVDINKNIYNIAAISKDEFKENDINKSIFELKKTFDVEIDLGGLKFSKGVNSISKIQENTPTNENYSHIITRVNDFIFKNYNIDFSLDKIVDEIGLNINTSYLCRIYKKEMGESIFTHILNLRVAKAIELLTDTDFKVYEISEIVGYKNLAHFHRNFKSMTGYSPAEYRNRKGEI